MSMMSAILCGTNFVLHSAGWLEGGLAMGYEKFVMDADFCGALHRWLEGVSLDDDEFALDGFHELGPGKHFFSAQHTLRHYETAFYDSPTADNNSFEQWRDAGETRTEERAAAIVAKTLAEYEPPPLDEAIDEALRDFIDREEVVDARYVVLNAQAADRLHPDLEVEDVDRDRCRARAEAASRCRPCRAPAATRRSSELGSSLTTIAVDRCASRVDASMRAVTS